VSDQGWEHVCNVYGELLFGTYDGFDGYLIKYCKVIFLDFTNLDVIFYDAYIATVTIVLNVEWQFIVKQFVMKAY